MKLKLCDPAWRSVLDFKPAMGTQCDRVRLLSPVQSNASCKLPIEAFEAGRAIIPDSAPLNRMVLSAENLSAMWSDRAAKEADGPARGCEQLEREDLFRLPPGLFNDSLAVSETRHCGPQTLKRSDRPTGLGTLELNARYHRGAVPLARSLPPKLGTQEGRSAPVREEAPASMWFPSPLLSLHVDQV